MDILLDTHLLLWALEDSEYLPESVRTIINNEKTELYYSTVSMWEVAIKHKKGKLKISGTELFHYCEQAGFKELVLNEKHIIALETIEKIEDRASLKQESLYSVLIDIDSNSDISTKARASISGFVDLFNK